MRGVNFRNSIDINFLVDMSIKKVYFLYMVFEYDREKSDSNILKHGIDFEDVQQLWDDPERIEIPAKTVDESRFLIIGKIHDRIWSCVIPYRGEKIRIISARRSRDEEVQLYEST